MISIICLSSQSWTLPRCPSSGYFDNCYGNYEHSTGYKYIGEFKNNKYHGYGIGTFKDGEKYVGQFKQGKYNGQGKTTFVNGNKHIGEYKHGQRNGLGIMFYLSGDTYLGEYKNAQKHGQGIYKFVNGIKEVGEFKNSKLNGYAIRYGADGSILKEGIWKDDKFIYANKPTSNSKIEGYKNFCSEIGFTPGTEKFGECVVEAMKKG